MERVRGVCKDGRGEDKMNLYEVLGVSKQATVREIKKAFRERIKCVHPDVVGGSGDTALLNRLCYAKDILCDVASRREYDSYLRVSEFGWKSVFDLMNHSVCRGATRAIPVDRRPTDGRSITVVAVYNKGCGFWQASYRRLVNCGACGGVGVVFNEHTKVCPQCEGEGVIDDAGCLMCYGIGKINWAPCGMCMGVGQVYENRVYIIDRESVEVVNGEAIIEGEGNEGAFGGKNGDLIVEYAEEGDSHDKVVVSRCERGSS